MLETAESLSYLSNHSVTLVPYREIISNFHQVGNILSLDKIDHLKNLLQ